MDDELYEFGSAEGNFSQYPVNRDQLIEAVWENDTVRVEQDVSLVRRKSTGKEEGVLIRYRIENKSKTHGDIRRNNGLETIRTPSPSL